MRRARFVINVVDHSYVIIPSQGLLGNYFKSYKNCDCVTEKECYSLVRILVTKTPQNYDIDLDVCKIAKEIEEEKYALKVYLLPAREVVVTWMTVLQCMYGCRVYSRFSRRWSRVPFCPNPDETKKIVSDYKFALILNKTYKPPLFNTSWLGFNPLRDLDQKIWATRCYGEINSITLQVEKLLMNHGFDVYAYGMSPCHACIKCSYPKPCRKPDKLRFSADACGIDIYATARKAGANFEVPPLKEINLFEIVLIR
jgi:predicted metal-binding protein